MFSFHKPIVLASASKQRQRIFQEFDIPVTIKPANLDESVLPQEKIEDYGKRMAKQKAQAVLQDCPQKCLVIAADTCVFAQGKIIGKPKNKNAAQSILQDLQKNPHQVFSFVQIIDLPAKTWHSFHSSTKVEFYPYQLSIKEQPWLFETSVEKSGGYSIEQEAKFLVKNIHGSLYNVVGFPIEQFLYFAWEQGWWHFSSI